MLTVKTLPRTDLRADIVTEVAGPDKAEVECRLAEIRADWHPVYFPRVSAVRQEGELWVGHFSRAHSCD
jgi:hypothetical protein